MRIPKDLLDKARKDMGTPHPGPTVWYVAPGEVVIGYATSPDAVLTAHQLNKEGEPEVPVTCTAKKAGKREELYWLVATMNAGTVWFEWTLPGTAQTQKILVHADAEPDTYLSRAEDAARIKKCQVIWKLMARTHKPYQVVVRVLDRAGGSLKMAGDAFKLVEQLLKHTHGNEAEARHILKAAGTQSALAKILHQNISVITSPKPEVMDIVPHAALFVFEQPQNERQ